MKTLNFSDGDGGLIYELLYDGLLNSGRGFEAPSETRIVSHILDKLEAVGVPTERGGLKTFSLRSTGDHVVRLEDVEYEIMRLALREVKWSARAARYSTLAMEFFQNASKD